GAHLDRKARHLGQAARDKRGARVEAEAEAVADAGRDRDDVFDDAAHLDADDVARRINAKIRPAEHLLDFAADTPAERGAGPRRRLAAGDFERERRTR